MDPAAGSQIKRPATASLFLGTIAESCGRHILRVCWLQRMNALDNERESRVTDMLLNYETVKVDDLHWWQARGAELARSGFLPCRDDGIRRAAMMCVCSTSPTRSTSFTASTMPHANIRQVHCNRKGCPLCTPLPGALCVSVWMILAETPLHREHSPLCAALGLCCHPCQVCMSQRLCSCLNPLQAAEYWQMAFLSLLSMVQSSVVWVGLAAGMVVCVWGVAAGTLTVGDTVLFLTMMQQLYVPLTYFGSYYRQVSGTSGARNRACCRQGSRSLRMWRAPAGISCSPLQT